MRTLRDKHVLLCVSGGIAAYKSAELVRRLTAAGATVQVAMTSAATRFITPLTLQTLSRRPVALEILDAREDAEIGHIRLADEADVVLVAPATADLIARLSAGMANDVVAASILATRAPVVVAPAMNTHMLTHPATVRNLATLSSYGYRIVEPDRGELACGYEGAGRLPDPEVLVAETAAALSRQDLAKTRVLISAGPTCEPIDPVRHVSNRSSGKMGYAIAAAAWRRGARVTVVAGPTALATPHGCEVVRVRTAAEMNDAMLERVTESDAIVMVAAVADYRPAVAAARKIKKGSDERLVLELEKTTDILSGLAGARGDRILVGFAAETNDLRGNAIAKLRAKGLHLIVANDVSDPSGGFDVDTNSALLIDSSGNESHTGLVSKEDLAEAIIDAMVRIASMRRKAVETA